MWAVTFNIILCLLAYFYSAAAYKVGIPRKGVGPANLAASTEMGSPQHVTCKFSGAADCKM